MSVVLAKKEMFLRAQAFGECLTTVPDQSVTEPRSESEAPVLRKRREKYRQTCDDGPKGPKFSYSSSQNWVRIERREGRPKSPAPELRAHSTADFPL